MKRSLLLYLLAVFFFFACNQKTSQKSEIAVTQATQQKSPNIIVILLDDAGYADFGFMGSEDLETPHIDQLAKDGVIFTDAHVSATVCAPSRAGLITGQYQQRFGFEANHTGDEHTGDIGLATNVITMADVFQKNNYKTIAIGKWHLGAKEHNHPNNRGFNEFYGFLAGGRSYFPMKNPSVEHMLQNNGERVIFDGYLTDVLGDKSVSFVEEHKNQPFFMYLSYNAVHTPMEAKEEDLKKYDGHDRQVLAAMTWSLDQNIGKLRNKLQELNLIDNTLIFFLSDNGGAHNNDSNHGVLKGWKGNKFEAGHRVPFVMSWPQEVKGNTHFDGLTSSLDIFTTAIAAAGIQPDQNQILDGVDLLPFLKGDKTGNPHNELYWRKLDEAGARLGHHKLVRLKNYGSTLYNLSDDIGETNNLTNSEKDIFKSLKENLLKWEANMAEPLWGEGEEWEDVTFHIHQRLMENKEVLYKEPNEKKRLATKTTNNYD